VPAAEHPPAGLRRRVLAALLPEQQSLAPVEVDAPARRGVVGVVGRFDVRRSGDGPERLRPPYLGPFLVRFLVRPLLLQAPEVVLGPAQLLSELHDAPLLGRDGRDEVAWLDGGE